LSKKINPAQLNPDMLIGKYVPNLIAQPFEVSRQYAQKIYDQTSSPRLDKVLRNWEQDKWGSPDQRQKLAYTILVELLAVGDSLLFPCRILTLFKSINSLRLSAGLRHKIDCSRNTSLSD
jgi:hypothetical protein